MKRKHRSLKKKSVNNSLTLMISLNSSSKSEKLGSFSQILGMLPGIDKKMLESVDTEENENENASY